MIHTRAADVGLETFHNDVFVAFILGTLGYAAYRSMQVYDFQSLILQIVWTMLVSIGALALVILVIVTLLGFGDVRFKMWRTATGTLVCLCIVAWFVYRVITQPVPAWSVWLIIHATASICILSYYDYQVHRVIIRVRDWCIDRRERREGTYVSRKRVEAFLETPVTNEKLEELAKFKDEYKLNSYATQLVRQYKPAIEHKLMIMKHFMELRTLNQQADVSRENLAVLEQDILRLEEKKQQVTYVPQENTQQNVFEIDEVDTDVHLVDELSEYKIEILLERGYRQVNEYDLVEKRVVTALVKPILNHSSTHTFLVWSAMRLLQEFPVTKIEAHLTRDADITFKHHNKIYAIEIETGTLLGKKKQLQEKIAYLNKKYPQRWFFLVSNQNSQSQYNVYGIATRRINVAKRLNKMLKIPYPPKIG